MNSLPRSWPRSAGSLSILEFILRLWLFKAMNGSVPQYLSYRLHVHTRRGQLISCALPSQNPGKKKKKISLKTYFYSLAFSPEFCGLHLPCSVSESLVVSYPGFILFLWLCFCNLYWLFTIFTAFHLFFVQHPGILVVFKACQINKLDWIG